MYNNSNSNLFRIFPYQNGVGRYINPNDITIENGYKIEVFMEGLNTPACILLTEDGSMLIADTGYTNGIPTVSILKDGQFEVIADNFNVPLTGINYRNGDIYVSHMGAITVIKSDGSRNDIITGLPSYGDYSNSRVAFGQDGKMYFGQGTATNSGVVGLDNIWVEKYSFFHDNPGSYILLNDINFETINMLSSSNKEIVRTGAFSPYGVPNTPHESKKGIVKASGSILRANLDGSELELVAWGLRSPSYVKFDTTNRLFASNNGCDLRGSRPIANAPDEFQQITPGVWYGWPDYVGGDPVTLERYRPDGGIQPTFLMSCHPGTPPDPYAFFPPDSTIIGFDFNTNPAFGKIGDAYIAEFGSVVPSTYIGPQPQYPWAGHKISKIDMFTKGVTTFAVNKSGFSASITKEGGFGRPSDIAFDRDGTMYVVDMGINSIQEPSMFIPNTGVIWKITRI